MKLSVIIPCFNAANTIAVQLEALANQHWPEPWEVIVSDNGSTDETLAIVEQYREKIPNLRIVNSSDRRGAAHARNVGVMAAASEALAFCDTDDEVAPGWVAAMAEALSKYDFVAGRRDYEKLNEPWTLKIYSHTQVDGLKKSSFLPHASSFNLGVRRSIHEAISGFDETMLRHQDADYCWRIQLAGTELHFVPTAVVHYRLRPTIAGLFHQGRKMGEYNVLLYKKYRPLGMPKHPWKKGAKAWLLLLKHFPQVFSKKEDRARWVADFAGCLGRLQGCIKYQVLAP
jgi:glycosyltransferase involved in cell wall biosynthesis